jgi:hypothetical protein
MTKMPNPAHLFLGELIARLREEPDQSRRVKLGFRHPHSYRGDYMELAFELAEDVTVGEMLAAAESALGSTYQGWKGGDYVMDERTFVWLVSAEGDDGETLGAVLLTLMLAEG